MHRFCPLVPRKPTFIPIRGNCYSFVKPYLQTHLQRGPRHSKDMCQLMFQDRMWKSLRMNMKPVSERVFNRCATCANQSLFLFRRCINIRTDLSRLHRAFRIEIVRQLRVLKFTIFNDPFNLRFQFTCVEDFKMRRFTQASEFAGNIVARRSYSQCPCIELETE